MLTMKPNIYFKKGELKNLTLTAIDSGCHYSRDIFNAVGKTTYKNFTNNLYNLCRRGYISKTATKPKVYKLTKKGKQHLANPNIFQEKRDLLFSRKLESIMKDTDMFKSMMIKLGNEEMQNKIRNGENLAPSVVFPVVDSNKDFGDGEIEDKDKIDNKDEINNKDKLIDNLLDKISLLKREKRQVEGENEILISNNISLKNENKSGNGTPKIKSNNNLKLTSNRKKLNNQYLNNGGYLDLNFFEQWGIHPCLLKSTKIFNRGSIDIISKSNEEFTRGHIKKLLSDSEIINSGMRIVKFDENGVWVNCKGMTKAKILKFNRFSKNAPQQSRPQTKPTQTQRQTLSIRPSKRM